MTTLRKTSGFIQMRLQAPARRGLPDLEPPQFPMWLTVHRELQTSLRIRAVSDFLAPKLGGSLQVRA